MCREREEANKMGPALEADPVFVSFKYYWENGCVDTNVEVLIDSRGIE